MALCKHQEENCTRCAMDGVQVPPIQVYFILDTSTSMSGTWDKTLEGINEYFASLRQEHEDEAEYRVSLITFDSEVRELYDQVLPDNIPAFTKLTLKANGRSTCLFDAVGFVSKKVKTDDPALIVIFTDGQENSSKVYDHDKMTDLVEAKQKEGNYTFVYMGVDKAAWNKAESLGIHSQQNSANFTASSTGRLDAFSSLTVNSSMYRSEVTRSYKGAVSRGLSPKAMSGSTSFFKEASKVKPSVPQADGDDDLI